MEKIVAGDPLTRSKDVTSDNLKQMQTLFPEAFTEGNIDFEVLKHLLGGQVEERDEKYGLNWHGKRRAHQLALTPSTATLRPCLEESVNWGATQNLMIEGDNLETLKLLQKSYASKVKLIYIDPPYNTGKGFVYPDDYRDNIHNYLHFTGQIDGEKRKFSTNTESSGRFHTDWLNMMYPRIRVARDLLTDDGTLLASINDKEIASLRFILDDIFGEENFLCQFVWNNDGNVDQQSKIKGVHEYIVAYARNLDNIPRPTVIDPNIDENSKLFNSEIENSITKNGPANPPSKVTLPVGFPAAFEEDVIIPERTDKYPHILIPITVQDGHLQEAATLESGWSSRNLLDLFINNGCTPIRDNEGKETRFALTTTGALYMYKRRSELQGHVISVIRNVGTTKQNSSMLSKWGIKFSYPKPVLLLQYLAEVFTSTSGNDLVLDFFAGSGTMGQAVLQLNSKDKGNRRFALIQFPEEYEQGQTLFDVCKKRVECAANEIRNSSSDNHQPLGFRVFKLASSNIRAWTPDRNDLQGSLLESIDHIVPDRSNDDILYELLLKLGIDLCAPLETRTIAGKSVRSIASGTLLTCLDETIALHEVEPLALGIAGWYADLASDNSTVVFRDNAFVDDVAKSNLTAILDQHGLRRVRSL